MEASKIKAIKGFVSEYGNETGFKGFISQAGIAKIKKDLHKDLDSKPCNSPKSYKRELDRVNSLCESLSELSLFLSNFDSPQKGFHAIAVEYLKSLYFVRSCASRCDWVLKTDMAFVNKKTYISNVKAKYNHSDNTRKMNVMEYILPDSFLESAAKFIEGIIIPNKEYIEHSQTVFVGQAEWVYILKSN